MSIDVVVHAQTLASSRTMLIELRPVAGAVLPAAEPGAHIDLHLGAQIRQYSLLDTATPGRYLVCVQHRPQGRGGSRYVFDRLRVGDRLRISVPRNTFSLDEDATSTLLVAGGVGITPLLAMAERLWADGRDFGLHAYARTREEAPLAEYVAGRPYAERVTWHLSEQGDSLRAGRPAWLEQVGPASSALYVCGPAGFTDTVRHHALAVGVAEDAVHSERFTAEEPVDTSGETFTVVAASSGRRLSVPAGRTVAEVLEEHGYPVALSCEQGICGSCVTSVLGGRPDHRDEVLSDAEHQDQMCVCVSRALTPELVLDV